MNIIVIGGGAAGMMAALSAARQNPSASVLLLEKNDKLGKKIFITGKGRGNFTNACPMTDFPAHYLRNTRFLYPAFRAMSNTETIRILSEGGCRSVTERGGRVFPVSGHAYSITEALKRLLRRAGAEIRYRTEVLELLYRESGGSRQVSGVRTKRGVLPADAVIVATGGLSYPSTGSTGDGYRFAAAGGLRLTPCCPSLVWLAVEETDVRRLKGLTLRNIAVSVTDENGRRVYEDFGEMHFLEEGVDGPVILSASAVLTGRLSPGKENGEAGQDGSSWRDRILTLHIDLKPALTEEMLRERLARDFSDPAVRKAALRDSRSGLLPAQLIPVFLRRLETEGVDSSVKCAELPRETRRSILRLLKDFRYTLRGTGGFSDAIVTQGGVDVSGIRPDTMEAKNVRGLYFAGEVLDVDGFTGGFNMQAAFSTGWLAGRSAAAGPDQ